MQASYILSHATSPISLNTYPEVSYKSINNANKTNKELTFYFSNPASPSSLVIVEMLSQ